MNEWNFKCQPQLKIYVIKVNSKYMTENDVSNKYISAN